MLLYHTNFIAYLSNIVNVKKFKDRSFLEKGRDQIVPKTIVNDSNSVDM